MLITHECSIGAANPQIPLKLPSIDFMLVRGRKCTTQLRALHMFSM